jgi:hypothetical protein
MDSRTQLEHGWWMNGVEWALLGYSGATVPNRLTGSETRIEAHHRNDGWESHVWFPVADPARRDSAAQGQERVRQVFARLGYSGDIDGPL